MRAGIVIVTRLAINLAVSEGKYSIRPDASIKLRAAWGSIVARGANYREFLLRDCRRRQMRQKEKSDREFLGRIIRSAAQANT